MKKIGALVYRELLLAKRFYITDILIVFGVSAFGYLILMSMEFGNIAKIFEEMGGEMADITKNSVYYIFNYLTAALWCLLLNENGTSSADIKTKWRMYGFTMPVTDKENALVKLIINVSGVILCFSGAVANGLIISAISGIDFDFVKSAKAYLLIIALSMLFCFFGSAALSWARTEKEAGLSNVVQIFTIIIMGNAGFFLFKGSEEFSPYISALISEDSNIFALKNLAAKILERFGAFALPCIILLTVVSYFVNLRLMKRRYK
ncbi:MAG: hypothetical protein J6B75_05255 [Ruminococcus sp.]|nr:hypothetical protein [Ruminococcus sp.]